MEVNTIEVEIILVRKLHSNFDNAIDCVLHRDEQTAMTNKNCVSLFFLC